MARPPSQAPVNTGSTFSQRLGLYLLGIAIGLVFVGVLVNGRQRAAQQQQLREQQQLQQGQPGVPPSPATPPGGAAPPVPPGAVPPAEVR